MPHSNIISDTFFYSRCKLTRTQQLDDAQRGRNFGLVNPKWDIFIKPLPSGMRAIWKRRQKDCLSQRGWVSTRKIQQGWQTSQLTKTVAACTVSLQVQARWVVRVKRGKYTSILILNQEAIANWHLLAKKKTNFLQ